MNQQPDKFFKEKLAGYQQPAPASAWEKIATLQKKKNQHVGWMKIAASVLLISLAAYFLWPQKGNVGIDQNTLAEVNKSPSPTNTSPQELPHPKTMPHDDQPQQDQVAVVEKLKTAVKPVRHPTKSAEPQPVLIQNAEENRTMTPSSVGPEDISAFETNSETTLLEPYARVSEATVTAPQKITLTYTAEDVNKYLDKKSMAQATSEEKKPSTLMKLLKKANDLKNNQDPMGELRQKKNEILALNFKNDKQRGQNK